MSIELKPCPFCGGDAKYNDGGHEKSFRGDKPMRCDFKSMRECNCPSSECLSAPPKPIAHAIIPTWRDQFAVCVFVGALTGIAFFGVMASQEGHQKITDLINQENVHVVRR